MIVDADKLLEWVDDNCFVAIPEHFGQASYSEEAVTVPAIVEWVRKNAK